MKRTFGKTLIIFIIAMLLLTLVACAGGDNTDATGGDNEKTPSDIDAVALADLIQKGLVATSYEIADMTKRHVVSTYEFRVNTINLTIVYEANYDDARNEDSEILLKIYDNTNAKNSTFFYYNDGELYYEINGSRNYVPEYTYSGTFSIFYDLIALFDVGGYIFGDPNMFASEDEFIKEEDDMGLDSFANYMRAIITGAELKSLAVYGESDAYKNIRISDVSLDKIKEPINDFLTSYIKGYIGDKLDVLSQLFLGFQLSELGNVGVGIINVNTLEMAMRDGSIKNINLVLDGVQTDNIHPFYVSVAYDLTPGHVDIALDPTDDPDNNPIRTSESDPANGYWLSRSGETHLKGTLFVDLLNETFDVDLKANLDFSNNETNQFLLDVRKKTVNVPEGSYYHLDKEIASFYYNHNGDELLYISLEGLMKDYLGGGIALEELGFPKAKLDGLDMAKEMSYYLTMILEQLSYDITLTDVLNRIGGLGQVTDRLDIFIAKSKTIGGTYYELTIDNEFVQAMLGDYSATVLSRLSSYIGVDEEIIMAILGLGIFDNLKLLVGFDLITGEINISLYNSNTRYFVFSLFNQRITDTNFKVQPPSGFEPSLYKDFEAATSLHLHTEGLLYMQGAAETDLSSLLGLFIGDDTGLNSPFALTINDKLYLSADIWEVGDDYFVTATIWLNPTLKAGYEGGVFQFTAADILETEIPLIKIYTSREDPEYFLIELRDLNFSRGVVQKPVKYKASRSGLFDVFTEMRGAGNIFTGDNYNEIYDILSRDTTIELNSEWIVARLSPYNVGGIQYDPIYDILGVPNMSASLKLKISFRPLTAEDDQWAYAADESMYVLPVIERLSDLAFETMYEAKWHQTAQVYFGDDGPYDFKLTFDGDSSIIVDGIYRYMPVATLFGQDVTYVMLIKNQAIGTKYITTLVADSLQFDPIAENPIPTEIEVYYDDPTALEPVKGFQKFVIEDFGYTVDMIRALTSGATLKYYTIVIGKDSIAEMRFSLGIEILNRNFLVDEYIGNVPIVASIQIDPYEYAILMAESKPSNAQDEWIMYNPLAAYNNLDLYFGTTANQEKYPATFDWQLTQAQRDSISYHGGRFFVYSKYYTATVALEVVVVAKEIDYIQVIHILEDGSTLWELPGEYTIDSIDSATHQIPKVSTNTIQLRVYFKPAADQLPHYRIIGTSTGANLDDYCDGYYGNFQFAWKYASVDISIISLDETINTLARGTNIDTAEFINNFIGTQTVSLLVRAPTRRIQPVADSVLAYTVLDTNNGDFNLSASITELVRASDVAYRKDSNGNYITNDYIIADPLKPQTENVMPTSVSFQMMFAGKLIWKSYPIIWDKHPMVNGIYITNMLAVEAYVQITGTIGNVDGKKQTITMIIENANGAYESLKMYYDESGTQVVEEDDDGSHKITIDPYNPKALPVRLDVKYSGIDNADTFYVDGVDIYWMYESKRVDENTFNYKGGNYILTVRLPGDIEIGRLPLLVSIDVSILDMTVSEGKIYGLLGNNNTEVGVIDTFSVESAILLKNLESDTTQIGVSYQNSQTVSEIVIPVKWENAKEVIDALKGYKSTETAIILKGVIYENSDSLRQVVTCPIKINARVVESISFTALGDLTTRGALTVSSSVALDEENNIMKGTLEFDIKMPFALVNAEGGKYMVDSSGNHSNLVLYNFLRSTLSSIYIEFSDSPQNAYFSAIYTDNISEIDATVFRALSAMESDMGEHVYKFRITNIGNGSAVTSLDVSVKVHKDVLSSNAINLGVETFGEMAQLLYQDEPYYLPNEITVSYRQSGLVTYSDIIWIASGTAATVVGFDSEKNRQYITSQYFFGATGFTGQSFTVSYVIQPQSETVSLVLSFLSKNINEYNYSASAAEGNSQYNILDGILTVSNIYSFGTFDSSKIPSTIEPSATVSRDGFQTSGDAIKFISNWLPLEGYALAGNQLEFDVDKIMKEINAAFESTSLQPPEIIIGFMRLIMYDNRTQDIKLKIKVDRFVGATISREDATFDQNSTATLNIYEYNRDGVFDLYNQPTTFVFQSSTGGYVTHTFEGSELAFYIKASGGAYQSIQQIPFSYQGHELGTAYGNPNDTLTLTAYYKYDGSTDRYIGQFNIIISKAVIEKVEITNYGYNDNDAAITALIDDAYYIDPYDDTTFELPSVINVVFNTGSRVDDLAVDAYEITDGPFSDGKFDLAEFLTDQATYSGKSYTLKFNFTSFGGTAIQEYSIDVIIFDRSFTVKGDDQSVSVDNPFTFLTSDLPDISELLEFNSLEGELYKKYWNSNLVPFNLKIEWQTVTGKIAGSDVKDVVVTDDIFTIAGFDFTLSGVVKGAVEGVTINIRVFSPKLEYFGIATSDNSIMTLIEFFQDGASKNRSFEVLFSVAGSQDLKRITFIPYDSHSDASDETGTALIDWGVIESNTIRTVKFYNYYKTSDNNIIVDNKQYKYSLLQVTYAEIDFGYGYAESNEVKLVLDPFVPVIPSKVDVKGSMIDKPYNVVENQIEFGSLYLIWPDSIYEMPMNGGITTVRVGVVAEIDENGAAKEGAYIEYFYVNVYYLNRQPTLIERQIASGSNVTYSVVYQRTTTSIYSFTIDPINYDYDVTSGQYRLPTVLRVTFTSTYPDGDPRALYVSNEGTTFMLRDVRWVYPEIPLSGTATLLPAYILLPFDTSTEMIFEIGMPVAGGYANYQKPDYEIANKNGKAGIASFFDLHLDVTDRSIVSTTISEAKPPKEQTPYGVTHVAINAIDPYNIEFPTTVGITFKEGTGTVTRSFTNVVWEYDKSYLENEAVISGLIGDAAMTVLAKMKVYGAILPIQFPIKDRNIDTEIGGSTIAIDGGTIYILKGIPASEQLPQYLYYNFNGEFARVPIVWSLGNTVKTDDVIVYENIAATLGTVNKNNIVFDIEVIDPIVYCLQGIGDAVKAGGFIFDNIIVAVSGDNSYFSGQEAVLLPQRIFVNEAQHYLSVESVQYDIDRKVAVFNCSYDFITIGSGDSTSLRGTDGVSTLLYLSFEVPLDTYPSTAVVSTYSFPDGTAIKHFPLGYPILASDMPPATLSEGGSTTMSTLDLIWDFSSVNIYRAGEYNVVGYYKTAFGNNNSLNFTIIIDKRELSDSQFTISDSWLYRTYSVVGVPLQAPTNLTLGTFLKEDGSGDSTIKYIVEYSPVDTNQWTSVVPVNVGTYQVRIRVDDNNYLSNSTTTPISFTIAQQYVNLNDVTFSINNSAYVNSGATLTFDYDGVAHDKLLISGIPSDDSTFKYTVTYQRMSDFAVIAAPLNAGQYRLVLEIEQSQNSNYDISQTGDLIVYLNINQKQMSYQISNTVTYKGTGYTTLPIANIDMTDPNFIITYKFYNSNGEPISELLDVGLYAYTLEINGGTNYSSAKYGFDSGALPVNVVKRTLDIKLTNLSSEYLSDILDLNLALWFKDTNTGEEFGLSDLSARDQFLIRNYLSVYVDGGISNKHIVGEYAIHVKYDTANTLANYTFNSYQQGNYVITATAAIQIANRAALIEHLQTLTDGEIYKYYLSPGDYGDIEVNRVLRNGSYVLINASVTLIGAYDIAAGEATGETIAVTLRSVIVHSGALTLDIIKMQALPISAGKPGTGVSISAAASDVTISRSYFYRDLNYYVGYIASSTAIMTDPLYKGTVYITDNTVIKGHSIAAALYGGSLVVSDSEISENINGIQVNGNATGTSTNRIAQSVIVINSKFLYNKGTALYILCNVTDANLNFSVMGNDFIGNVLAVKTFEPLTLELLTTQNYMYLNVADLINF